MNRARPTLIASDAPAGAFPPDDVALEEPNGLTAIGGDLSPERLLEAYRRGIFPWYEQGQPILWWTPDPRLVLMPQALRISRSLRRSLKRGGFEISFDAAFSEVIGACAEPRASGSGTWITPAMIDAYIALAERGAAHSIEVWRGGELVGGIYGVAMGVAFFGESMFSRERDASKIALVELCHRLSPLPRSLVDCQVASPHLMGLGAELISRREFRRRLAAALAAKNPWCSNRETDFRKA
ncbi:MAG: leucyl/phenylalanyl-tRNA--protein transferase [Gammaproteobacteria bacterium]